jgi:serine/threonine-protein kinase
MKLCPTCKRCYEESNRSCEVAGHEPLVNEREGSRMIGEKYRLDSRIGEGAMGTVYRATLVAKGDTRAVKLLNPKYVSVDPKARERFRNEGKTGPLFEHRNVVKTYDYGEVGGDQAYLAMELLDGQSLRDYMRERRLAIDEAVDIALQAASGAEALHGKEILHRDLKPENIMLISDGRGNRLVKLLDFGLAKPIKRLEPEYSRTTVALKEFVGTIKYTSPENCNGEILDERSDIYSLGVILYEMLAGRTPFGGTDDEVERQHREATPTPVEKLRPDVPAVLAKLVAESLNKDPKQRPQRARELVDHLKYIATTLGLSTKPDDEAVPGGVANHGPVPPSPPAETRKQPPPVADTPRQTARVENLRGGDQLFERYITQQPMPNVSDNYTAPLRNKPSGVQYGLKLPSRKLVIAVLGVLLLFLVSTGSCYVYPFYRSRQAKAHLERGVALVELNKLDEALGEFDDAVEFDPTLSQAYFYRGVAYSKRGDYARAVADYNETIKLDPLNASAYQNRAEAHLAAGANDKAVEDYTQLLQLSSGPDAYKLRGDAHLKSKNYQQAIEDYTEALKRDPSNPKALEARGDAYTMRGDTALGLKDYRSARKLRTLKK